MNQQNLSLFQKQIKEDINLIESQLGYVDLHLSKPEYAFNYWILSRIFSIDEEIIPEYITEYNDKAIDCYVYYEDSKELYIIQNKFRSSNDSIARPDVSDFLKTPLALLNNNQYRKSHELQSIFNKAKNDPDFKIEFHFYATTDKKSSDINQLVKDFNKSLHDIPCLISASYFGLSQLYDLYYGRNYQENIQFKYELGTINRGTFASIREVYGIEGLYEAYYIVTPVIQIYKMLKAAEDKGYPLFEKNIREYLGDNPVNNAIVETLRSKEERKNFMYYNNGITVICQAIEASRQVTSSDSRLIPLINPQIVNGCQTVNSIKKVLENISDEDLNYEFKNVYVMLKALVIENPDKNENKIFYSNVVKYTNKQNAISDKAFTSNMDVFYRIQEEFKDRGFLLLVKPSDLNKFKGLSKVEKGNLLQLANHKIVDLDFYLTGFNDICIPLEKLLQVFLAFVKTGHFAFTKKNHVLQQGKEIFDMYTSQIHNFLTIDNMINLYCLYKKAEAEQKESSDKRTPIPYYVIGFLGNLIGEITEPNIQQAFNIIFKDKIISKEAYRYLVALCKNYRRAYENNGEGDYNVMIKRPIDEKILKFVIGNVNDIGEWETIHKWIVIK